MGRRGGGRGTHAHQLWPGSVGSPHCARPDKASLGTPARANRAHYRHIGTTDGPRQGRGCSGSREITLSAQALGGWGEGGGPAHHVRDGDTYSSKWRLRYASAPRLDRAWRRPPLRRPWMTLLPPVIVVLAREGHDGGGCGCGCRRCAFPGGFAGGQAAAPFPPSSRRRAHRGGRGLAPAAPCMRSPRAAPAPPPPVVCSLCWLLCATLDGPHRSMRGTFWGVVGVWGRCGWRLPVWPWGWALLHPAHYLRLHMAAALGCALDQHLALLHICVIGGCGWVCAARAGVSRARGYEGGGGCALRWNVVTLHGSPFVVRACPSHAVSKHPPFHQFSV